MSNAIGNKDIETFAGTDGCSFLVKRSVQRREVWCLHQCYGSKWSCTAHSCPGASITRSSQRAENILSLQSAPANKASCVPVWVTTPQSGSSLLRHWLAVHSLTHSQPVELSAAEGGCFTSCPKEVQSRTGERERETCPETLITSRLYYPAPMGACVPLWTHRNKTNVSKYFPPFLTL